MKARPLLARLDHWIATLLTLLSSLALPIIGLLFLQWPLRDLVQAGSREANDLGQIAFALYIASSITMASRAQTHLKSDMLSRHLSLRWQQSIKRIGIIFGLLPWAGFLVWAAWPMVMLSLQQRERFAETGHAGYFIIKGALLVMAVLIIVQGLLDLLSPARSEQGPP